MNLKTSQKGFTIVELLIVIVVIAILAAISIVAFTGIQQRGRDSSRASDASNIVKALTAYTTDDEGSGGTWPADAAAAKTALEGYTAAGLSESITDKLTGSATPTEATKDVYQYEACPAGATTPKTGAYIRYWKENGGAPVSVTAGKC